MDRAQKLAKIRDQEYESSFGYVYAVSGPGQNGTWFELVPVTLGSFKISLARMPSNQLVFLP